MKAKIEISEIDQLNDRLQRYDLYGLPELPTMQGNLTDKITDFPKTVFMESSWREIPDELPEMSKNEIMIQEAIWEIFITERSYM